MRTQEGQVEAHTIGGSEPHGECALLSNPGPLRAPAVAARPPQGAPRRCPCLVGRGLVHDRRHPTDRVEVGDTPLRAPHPGHARECARRLLNVAVLRGELAAPRKRQAASGAHPRMPRPLPALPWALPPCVGTVDEDTPADELLAPDAGHAGCLAVPPPFEMDALPRPRALNTVTFKTRRQQQRLPLPP